MIELLAAAALAAAPAAPPKAEVDRVYRAVKGSVVNVNMLLTSAQARFKRLQFAFNQAGAQALKDQARRSFDDYTERLSSFRSLADATEAGRPGVAEAAKAAAKAAEPPKDSSTKHLLDEIAAMRSGYDAGASSRSLAEVRAALKRWPDSLGAKLKPAQERALAEGRSLAARAREAAKRLTPKTPLRGGPARAAGGELQALVEDAAALEVELELFAARYRLDNLLEAHPSLGGS